MAADANWLGAAAESSTGEAEAEDREGAALRLVAGMVDFIGMARWKRAWWRDWSVGCE